jgi:GNAT superfamily N-acetyltransferase
MTIVACGPERAEEVYGLTQAAFRAYTWLDPPSGALRETLERVRDDLAAGGGAIAEVHGEAVGCLRWQPGEDGSLHVRRVAVAPHAQRRGVGRALMLWAEEEARRRGCSAVTVGVRITLPGNLAFYRGLGYELVGKHRHDGYAEPTWLGLRKAVVG